MIRSVRLVAALLLLGTGGLLGAAAIQASVPARSGAARRSAGNARVSGTFAMLARVTAAAGIPGERDGQRLRRRWRLTPGGCRRNRCVHLTLERDRGPRLVERVRLRRIGPGRYAGTGSFWVPLECLGRTYPHGSRAPFQITLTVTSVVRVQRIRFARRIAATYVNLTRTDSTPCPLAPSHDAARYRGRLVSRVPAPPAAAFRATARAAATPDTVRFADTSVRLRGGARIIRRRWRFGDPASGASDTSTAIDPVHAFSAGGSYAVSLTVTDANGLGATVTRTVAVPLPGQAS